VQLACFVLAVTIGSRSLDLLSHRGVTDWEHPRDGSYGSREIRTLLNLTKVKPSGEDGDYEDLQRATAYFLEKHQWGETGWREWKPGAQGSQTLHGYFGKGIRRVWTDQQSTHAQEDDPSGESKWLGYAGGTVGDPLLDYIGLRAQSGSRTSRKPNLDSYEGINREDAQNEDCGGPLCSRLNRKGEIDDLSYYTPKEIEEREGLGRLVSGQRLPEINDSLMYAVDQAVALAEMEAGPPAFRWRQIEAAAMIRHDLPLAFADVFGSDASRAMRVFVARQRDGCTREDIPNVCGISQTEAETTWKRLNEKRGEVAAWLIKNGYLKPADHGYLRPIPIVCRAARSVANDIGWIKVEGGGRIKPYEFLQHVAKRLQPPSSVERPEASPAHVLRECGHTVDKWVKRISKREVVEVPPPMPGAGPGWSTHRPGWPGVRTLQFI
jgi:hypothetical protein